MRKSCFVLEFRDWNFDERQCSAEKHDNYCKKCVLLKNTLMYRASRVATFEEFLKRRKERKDIFIEFPLRFCYYYYITKCSGSHPPSRVISDKTGIVLRLSKISRLFSQGIFLLQHFKWVWKVVSYLAQAAELDGLRCISNIWSPCLLRLWIVRMALLRNCHRYRTELSYRNIKKFRGTIVERD